MKNLSFVIFVFALSCSADAKNTSRKNLAAMQENTAKINAQIPEMERSILAIKKEVEAEKKEAAEAQAKEIQCCDAESGDIGIARDPKSESVHLFARKNNDWIKTGTLRARHSDKGDAFGQSVAIENDLIVVGAPGEGGCAAGVDGDETDNKCAGRGGSSNAGGAVYVFRLKDGEWSQESYLKEDGSVFGEMVGLWQGSVVAPAPNYSRFCKDWGDSHPDCLTGRINIYNHVKGKWKKEASLPEKKTSTLQFGTHTQIFKNGILLSQGYTNQSGRSGHFTSPASPIFLYERKNGKLIKSQIRPNSPFHFRTNAVSEDNYLAVEEAGVVEETSLQTSGISVYKLGRKGWKRLGFIPVDDYKQDNKEVRKLEIDKGILSVRSGKGKGQAFLLSSFGKKTGLSKD